MSNSSNKHATYCPDEIFELMQRAYHTGKEPTQHEVIFLNAMNGKLFREEILSREQIAHIKRIVRRVAA